jgi:hypothetical protein
VASGGVEGLRLMRLPDGRRRHKPINRTDSP